MFNNLEILNNKHTRQQILKLIILTFKYDNIKDLGYQKYSFFYNHIYQVIQIKNKHVIRTLFQQLINQDKIKKIKNQKKVYYMFDPYICYKKTVNFNYNGVVTYD